jgi:hypothetical protein
MQQSLREAADHLKSRMVINDYEHSQLIADGWGRPFRWKVLHQGTDKVITITSDGDDGVSQDGSGDDLFIEATVPRTGPIKLRQNRPSHSVLH